MVSKFSKYAFISRPNMLISIYKYNFLGKPLKKITNKKFIKLKFQILASIIIYSFFLYIKFVFYSNFQITFFFTLVRVDMLLYQILYFIYLMEEYVYPLKNGDFWKFEESTYIYNEWKSIILVNIIKFKLISFWFFKEVL